MSYPYRNACPVCKNVMPIMPEASCIYCKADFSQFPPEVWPEPKLEPVPEEQVASPQETQLNPRWIVTLVMALFGGVLGIHRFYSGKVGTGILYLCTFGLAGFGVLIDLAMIASGSFKLKDGQPLRKY